jgi:hypothetical protein
MTFNYKVFGLTVHSAIELPELKATDGEAQPDVRITLAEPGHDDVPETKQESGNSGRFSIKDVAHYSISDGRTIVVEPAINAAARNVRLYLLGSAMGMVLHQRGILPLHATAVEIGGQAFAFMGESGAGKSTLAAWFYDRGHRIIADDVCAVRFDAEGAPVVSPGLSRLRLWKEALVASGRDSTGFERSYAGADDWDKFDVPTHSDLGGDAVVRLAGVYVLGAGEQFSISPLTGIEATGAIHAHTYRGSYLTRAHAVREHWNACLKLLGQGNFYTLRRRLGFAEFDEQAFRIRAHAEMLIRPSASLSTGQAG